MEKYTHKVTLQTFNTDHTLNCKTKPHLEEISKFCDIVNIKETADGTIVQVRNLKYRLSEIRRSF